MVTPCKEGCKGLDFKGKNGKKKGKKNCRKACQAYKKMFENAKDPLSKACKKAPFEFSCATTSPSPTTSPTTCTPAPEDYPQVETIEAFVEMVRNMYEKDYCGFAEKYNDAVKAVNPRPEGIAENVWEEWKDQDLDFLCTFFTKWYKWYPQFKKGDGLEYIQKFSWLYFKSTVGLNFVTTYPGTEVTKQFVFLRGAWMDNKASQPLAKLWVDQIGEAGMSDYVIPEGGYQSFNEFFKRPLKEPRPVSGADDASMCVSPADAIVNIVEDSLTLDGQKIQAKTQYISLRNMLNNSPLASSFVGGTALSCILMPDVYHRYHSPIGGDVVEADQDVAGNYFGIQDFPELINNGDVGYGYDYSVFEHFRRGYVIIKTKDYGYVAMIPVGLNTIATVIFEEKFKKVTATDEPVAIAKGEEIGMFQYGGSLCILLFQKGVFPSVRLPQGQEVGKLMPPAV